MSKIIPFIYLFLLLFSISNHAQEAPKKWKFAFQFDNRFSKISENEIVIFGAKAGLQYKKLTRFGLGCSFIANPVTVINFNKRLNANETNKINFWYFSVFNDWIIYKSKHWEVFATEQIGFGKPNFVKEINEDIVSDFSANLFVNEVSAQVDYKVLPWVGFGAGFGYRNILNPKERLRATLNAPIYIVKLIVYPEIFFKK